MKNFLIAIGIVISLSLMAGEGNISYNIIGFLLFSAIMLKLRKDGEKNVDRFLRK
jgi:mannose/fructose/N-acetylgalactosamine-specific phosphotransferase system component IIC